MLETCKQKVLDEIALFFLEKLIELDYNGHFHQLHSFVLDITDTKIFRSTNVISPKKQIITNMCILNFVNKDMADINVSKIFRLNDVTDSSPFNPRGHESIRVTTIRNKVFK